MERGVVIGLRLILRRVVLNGHNVMFYGSGLYMC
jgi:hypothetical protein